MKKLFYFLLPLLAAAWLASLGGCGKCKGVEGKVLEFGTDKPIPDASVTLSDCEGEVLGNFSCTDLAYATTNSDGQFDFGQDGFAVSAKAPGYWDTGDDFIMVTNECPKPVLRLYPMATLDVTIKNESGAYAFSSPYFNSSGHEYHLQIGETASESYTVRGNTQFTYVFDVFPQMDWKRLENLDSVLVMSNGQRIFPIFQVGAATFSLVPKGHETTKITITY